MRALAVLLATATLTLAARARAEEPVDGWLRVGDAYHAGSTPPGARLNPFSYPAIGFGARGPSFRFEGHSQALVVLPDAIGAAISFLSGGEGRPPLMNAMNGQREPGDVDLMSGSMAVRVMGTPDFRFEAGARGGLQFLSPYVEGNRISVQPVSIGPSFGHHLEADRFALDTSFYGGNAWTRFARWNPYFGASARAQWQPHGRIGLYFEGSVTRERIDFHGYEDSVSGFHTDAVDWLTLGRVEAGVAFRMSR